MISYGFYYDYAGEMIMRGGTELALYSARADYSTASKNAIRNELCLAHPQAILMGDATSVYNGYSYALYRQSISNNRCIFDISAALNDPHFVISAYGNWDDCNTGDIIVYKDRAGNVLHAGVIYNTNDEGVYVVSKWEDLCLFQHDVLDVPASFYSNYNTGEIIACAYAVTQHNYRVASYNGSGHTLICSICNETYWQAHVIVNGGCRFCGYVGSGSENPFG